MESNIRVNINLATALSSPLLFVYLMSYRSMRNIKTLFYYQAESPNFYCKKSKILGWLLAAHLVPDCFLVNNNVPNVHQRAK